MAREHVECHSEYTYSERPVAFHWEGERLIIVAVEAQWRTPGERMYRVRVNDGRIFELSYRESIDKWDIHES